MEKDEKWISQERFKKWLKIFVIFLAVMWVCTVISKSIYVSRLPRVQVKTQEKKYIEHVVEVDGIVVAGGEQAVNVLPGLRVLGIKVQEGDYVETGDLLFDIDLEDLSAMISDKETELTKQRMHLSDTQFNQVLESQKKEIGILWAKEDYESADKETAVAVERAKQALAEAETDLNKHLGTPTPHTSDKDRENAWSDYNQWKQQVYDLEDKIAAKQREMEQLQEELQNLELEPAQADTDSKQKEAATSLQTRGENKTIRTSTVGIGTEKKVNLINNGSWRTAENLREDKEYGQNRGAAGSINKTRIRNSTNRQQTSVLSLEHRQVYSKVESQEAENGQESSQSEELSAENEQDNSRLPENKTDIETGVDNSGQDKENTPNKEDADKESEEDGEQAADKNPATDKDSVTDKEPITDGENAADKNNPIDGNAVTDKNSKSDNNPTTDKNIEEKKEAVRQAIKKAKEELVNLNNQLTELNRNLVSQPDYSAEELEYDAWQQQKANLEDAVQAAKRGLEDVSFQREQTLRQKARDIANAEVVSPADSTASIYELEIAQLQEEIADLKTIKKNHGQMYAQNNGFITKVQIAAGSRTADTAAILLTDASAPCQFKCSITKEQGKYLHLGDTVELKVNGTSTAGSTKLEATVDYLTEGAGGYDIICRLPENTGQPGAGGSIRKAVQGELHNTVIPIEALYKESEAYYIYTLNEKTGILGKENYVEKIKVRITDQNDIFAALEAGTVGSEVQIVTFCSSTLKQGASVRLVE